MTHIIYVYTGYVIAFLIGNSTHICFGSLVNLTPHKKNSQTDLCSVEHTSMCHLAHRLLCKGVGGCNTTLYPPPPPPHTRFCAGGG